MELSSVLNWVGPFMGWGPKGMGPRRAHDGMTGWGPNAPFKGRGPKGRFKRYGPKAVLKGWGPTGLSRGWGWMGPKKAF